jgi:DNA anti-recombination protein RmuC
VLDSQGHATPNFNGSGGEVGSDTGAVGDGKGRFAAVKAHLQQRQQQVQAHYQQAGKSATNMCLRLLPWQAN